MDKMAKTYRTVDIKWLEKIVRDPKDPNKITGGVEDVGNFKEGFCFRIKTTTKAIWNFCADRLVDKQKWISAIQQTQINPSDSGKYGIFETKKDIMFPISVDKEPENRDG